MLTDLYIKVFYMEITLFLNSWNFFAQLNYYLLFEINVVFSGLKKTSFELRYPFHFSDTRGVLGKFRIVKQIQFLFQSFLDFKLRSRVINYFNWSCNGSQEKIKKTRSFLTTH